MTYGIAFAPLVPTLMLWIGLAAVVVIAAVLLLARARGAAIRVAALALILLALANPSFTREEREPLNDIVALVLDRSASQSIGDRTAQTDAARKAIEQKLAALGNVPATTREMPIIQSPIDMVAEVTPLVDTAAGGAPTPGEPATEGAR